MTLTSDTPEIRETLIGRMESVFGDDSRRIDHAMAVLGYAESIMDASPGV
ncbi:MAG: hypothetical protein GY794_25840, partial [bacterium]|nr:hypothetical protein [bacterium]